MKYLLILVASILIGCSPHAPDSQVYSISATSLARIYRDDDTTYNNQRVRVSLPANCYICTSNTIEYRIFGATSFVPSSEPNIVFRFPDGAPDNNTSPIVVTGICLGTPSTTRLVGGYRQVIVDQCHVTSH